MLMKMKKKKKKKMNNYSSLKSKRIYFLRMNVSKEAIYEYGEVRYNEGYTEGYKSGIITGHLLTIFRCNCNGSIIRSEKAIGNYFLFFLVFLLDFPPVLLINFFMTIWELSVHESFLANRYAP